MKTIASILFCFTFGFSFSQSIVLETFATNLSNPVNIKHAGDDRLFVVERSGRIQILNSEGSINSSAFLDIENRVSNSGGERGLLAMAFHPDYVSNGFFYVNYVDNSQNTVISRFTRNTFDTAAASSEVILLQITQPFSNHNGGDLHFGNDDYLYISLGDGGGSGDPGNRAQDLNLLLGKMLRIDVDNTENGNNYAIPPNNPYVGNDDALDEIWAYGLRNPFKFSFDKDNGALWIADVGQGQIEEIDRVTSTTGGENYGWKCFEGTSAYTTTNDCTVISHTEPVAEYSHTNGRCSITGGYVYRGLQYPALEGLYFFADFCSNEIGYATQTAPDNFDITFVDTFPLGGASAFGQDRNGELYVAGVISGAIFKITATSLSLDNNALSQIRMFPNPAQDQLHFDFEEANSTIHSIEIYSINGKLVLSSKSFENRLKTISTKTVSSGLYLVEITNIHGAKTIRKLMIQ